MNINIFMVIILLILSIIIYYDKNTYHMHVSIYLALLIILYVILSKLPNFEYFKIYDDSDDLLNIYHPPAEEIITTIEDETIDDPIKYGDTILIKCLAKEFRYLTGGRGGNLVVSTKELNEYVFTSDEDISLLQWIIRSSTWTRN